MSNNVNKTTKYLGNFYKVKEDYDSLRSLMTGFHHKDFFIADSQFYDVFNLTEIQNYYFVVCDIYGNFDKNAGVYSKSPLIAKKEFNENIKKLRKNKFLITDYKLSREGNKHVLVIKLPKNRNNEEIGKLLVEGRYSEIWTEQEVNAMYKIYKEDKDSSKYIIENNTLNKNIRGVLLKKEEYKAIFRKVVADKFKMKKEEECFVNDEGELDFSLVEEENWRDELINPSENWLYQVGLKTIKDLV